jgi:two-component system sensor histidine kinase BarA
MSPRILVVDDDRAMVKTLADIFRLRGWEVAAAHSGEEAVAVQRVQLFPHVLMDIKMPGIDGIAASRTIKEIAPSTHVILMTAHTAPEDLLSARTAGVATVLPKPIDLNSLFSMLTIG